MSANHLNITHPDERGIHSQQYRDRLEIEKLKVELAQLHLWYGAVCKDLEAIFNRIAQGQTSELHYPDGRVVVIRGDVEPE